jgi:hypothetical protein
LGSKFGVCENRLPPRAGGDDMLRVGGDVLRYGEEVDGTGADAMGVADDVDGEGSLA